MYKFLGNTDIKMYDLLNSLSFYVMLFFEFWQYKRRMSYKGGLSVFISNKLSCKNRDRSLAIALILELGIVTLFFDLVSGYTNGFVADLTGTGANYFGNMLVTPIFTVILFYLISVDPLQEMDLITTGLSLRLILVKMACFCAGCCQGFECSWGLYYPAKDKVMFPSQLLECFVALLIFIFLMKYRDKAKKGTLYPIYIILYSTTRFFTEFTRIEEEVFWIFKTYHILCLIGIVVGVVWLLIVLKFSDKVVALFKKSPFPWAKEIDTDYRKKKGITKKKINKNGALPKANQSKVGHPKLRMWILIWSLGLMGQIGWNVEAMWFNTFVYEKIDKNPTIITLMLIFSALASTLSIFLFGTLSDRTGKRRTLISTGYAAWGVIVILFGLTQFIPNRFLVISIICVVFGDMMVSFFGSMSTDVGYAAWTTDIMKEGNKGKIGAAIAVQSVLGSLLGNVIGGYVVGAENNYLRWLIVVGSVLVTFGVISAYMFTKKDDIKPSVRGTFRQQFFSVFDFRNVFKQKELIWVNISVVIFFIGFDTYYPHLGNYLIHHLGFTADKMGIVQAIPLVLAMVATVPVSKFIDNNKFVGVSIFAIISGVIGVFFMLPIIPESVDTSRVFDFRLFFGIFFIGVSYVVMLQTTKIWSKKLYPSDSKGQYEGLWAIAFVLLPMFFGSNISQLVIKTGDSTVLNEMTGQMEYIPDNTIFLVGVIISTLSFVPVIITKLVSEKNNKETKQLKNKNKMN